MALLSLLSFLHSEQQTLPIQTKQEALCAFCSDQRCFPIPHPWHTHTTEPFGASLRYCTPRRWANQTHRMHNAFDSHIFNYVPLNTNDFSNNFLTELKIPTKRSPLISEHCSAGISVNIVLQQTEILYISTHLQDDQNK